MNHRGPYGCSSFKEGILWQERILKRETADLRIFCSRFVRHLGFIIRHPCISALRAGCFISRPAPMKSQKAGSATRGLIHCALPFRASLPFRRSTRLF